jgi:catechol 2,3-dioxygenase-like lactoylglutathione lyase family enzyme
MIQGGTPTIFISDMQRAVDFYTRALGLALRQRYGDHWAEVDAGDGLILGLHPESAAAAKPGTAGGIQIGFNVTRPIEEVVGMLRKRGIDFPGGVTADAEGGIKLARFRDPDGNELYLCESPARE